MTEEQLNDWSMEKLNKTMQYLNKLLFYQGQNRIYIQQHGGVMLPGKEYVSEDANRMLDDSVNAINNYFAHNPNREDVIEKIQAMQFLCFGPNEEHYEDSYE